MAELGSAGGRGDFGTAVLEFGSGLAIVAVLHADALLIVLVQPATNVGALLFDLRRHRTAIAGRCNRGRRWQTPHDTCWSWMTSPISGSSCVRTWISWAMS
jgi:hypothetical protein